MEPDFGPMERDLAAAPASTGVANNSDTGGVPCTARTAKGQRTIPAMFGKQVIVVEEVEDPRDVAAVASRAIVPPPSQAHPPRTGRGRPMATFCDKLHNAWVAALPGWDDGSLTAASSSLSQGDVRDRTEAIKILSDIQFADSVVGDEIWEEIGVDGMAKCKICRIEGGECPEIQLKFTNLRKHQESQKHMAALKTKLQDGGRIEQMFKKRHEAVGERTMFVYSAVAAGMPIHRVYHSDFRIYFERAMGCELPSYEVLRTLVPSVEALERETLQGELVESKQSPSSVRSGGRYVSIGFDSSRLRNKGTTPLVIQWVDEDGTTHQRVVNVDVRAASASGEEERALITDGLEAAGVSVAQVECITCDSASVNIKALRDALPVPRIFCLAHMLHNAASKHGFSDADKFISAVIAAISQSYENQALLAGRKLAPAMMQRESPLPILRSPARHRWFSELEFATQLLVYIKARVFDTLVMFMQTAAGKADANKTLRALAELWRQKGPDIVRDLEALVVLTQPIGRACYALESDVIVPLAHAILSQVKDHCASVLKVSEHSVRGVSQEIQVLLEKYRGHEAAIFEPFLPVIDYVLYNLDHEFVPRRPYKPDALAVERKDNYSASLARYDLLSFLDAAEFHNEVRRKNLTREAFVANVRMLLNLHLGKYFIDSAFPDRRDCVLRDAERYFDEFAHNDERSVALTRALFEEQAGLAAAEDAALTDDAVHAIELELQEVNTGGSLAELQVDASDVACAAPAAAASSAVAASSILVDADIDDEVVAIDQPPLESEDEFKLKTGVQRAARARGIQRWWSTKGRAEFPNLFEVFRRALLLAPTNARVERVFSVLRSIRAERVAHVSDAYQVTVTMTSFNGRARARELAAIVHGQAAALRAHRKTLRAERAAARERQDELRGKRRASDAALDTRPAKRQASNAVVAPAAAAAAATPPT